MASFGSLLFYNKNGVSEPFLLSYGKTFIGSSASHHIRIKGEGHISCILDSNEVGVTILVNEDKNVLINNMPTSKYTVMKNGDLLEIGKKKFKYSNPSLKEEYIEQTQQTINKKVGTVDIGKTELEIKSNSSTLLKRMQTAGSSSKQRRFSTGSKVALAKMSPKIVGKSPLLSSHTSTPQSPSKIRFSRRMAARRNSTLASVMENDVFDFHSPKVTSISKTNPRVSFLAGLESSSVKKNKTFSGTSKFSSPIPAKNKTYLGNISDTSENITTPENSITVASITPLNVSKKTNNSMNRSRTLSYVDFPSSSTPKSAIRTNRSSSVYRPLVEDITPASPLARSSLRNSSIKMLAFTQRRSVNFNISSSSDHSSQQIFGSVNLLEPSSTGSKRKRSSIASAPESSVNAKKSKRTSSSVYDNPQEDTESLHGSSISGIQNFSDTSLNSNKNGSTSVLTPSKLLTNISFKDKSDSENQSIVSWNVEMSGTDMNLSGLSVCSSITETPLKSKRSTRLSNLNESASSHKKIDNDYGRSSRVKTLGVIQDDCSGSDTISLRLTRSSTSLDTNVEERQHSKRSSVNVSISNLESILDDSLEDFVSISSRSTRTYMKEIDRGKVRSKSLNLRKENKDSKNILSKTLDTNIQLNIPEQKSMRNVSSTPTMRTESRKSTISKSRSKSLNLRNKRSNSLHVPSKASTSMTLNFSPITPNSSKPEVFDVNKLNETESCVSKMSPSTSNTNLSECMEMYNVEDSVTCGISKRQRVPSSAFNDMSSCNSSVNGLNLDKANSATVEVLFKTPNAKRSLRRLETTNLSFTSTNDPSDIRSMEKLLQGSFEKSCRRSSRSSNLTERNLTALDDQSSTSNSLSKSWKLAESENNKSLSISSPNIRSFKVSSAKITPQNSKSMTRQQKTPKNDLSDISGVEELLKTPKAHMLLKIQNSPKNYLSNVSGVKKIMDTPKVQDTPKNDCIPEVQKSPKNDLSSVGCSNKSRQTPKIQKSPKNDLSNVEGIKKLLKTPRVQKTPKNDLTEVRGIKKLLKTPKVQNTPKNDLTDVGGIKKLLKTPKVQKTPKNDLTDVGGIKKLLKTPKIPKSPKNDLTTVKGLKKLMTTPKVQRSPNNDLTNIAGVKKLMKTPKVQRSPKNDLTNVGGVKKMMKSPKVQKSPKNDLTNVGGVKKLMTTPKLQKSPKNDLTKVYGLMKLMASPKQQKFKSNLTNVKGTKKIQKSPKNDLLDVRGVRNLLRTPKNIATDESYNLSGIDNLFNESKESNFDKLCGKKPPRTYGRSPRGNKSQEQQPDEPETPEHVLRWLEEQSKLEPDVQKEDSKSGKRKLEQSSDTPAENVVIPNKKQKVTRSTRIAHTNKDVNIFNISSSIFGKPSSTPNQSEQTTKQIPKSELSGNSTQIDKNNEQPAGTRSLRGRRKLESNDMESTSKKTRGTNSSKNKSKSNNTKENEIESPVAKRSLKTRQIKTEDDSVKKLPDETKTRQQRNKKNIKINKDISIQENLEEKLTIKRTRGKKEPEKRLSIEETIEFKKNTRSKRGKVQEEIVNIEEDNAPNERGNSIKQEVEEESTKVDNLQQPKRTRNKKKVEKATEKSIPIENIEEPTERGRRNIKAKNDEIVSEPEPKTRGQRNKKIEVLDIEPKPKRGGKKNTQIETEEESVDIETKSGTKKGGKNSKKNETQENKDEPEAPIKNTRRKKIEDANSEEKDQRTTRSNRGKNKKYNEEEWDTPVKKNIKKQTVTFKDDVEYSKTPVASIKDGSRNLRNRK